MSLIFSCFILMVSALSLEAAPVNTTECKKHSKDALHQMWTAYVAAQNNITHNSFYMLPGEQTKIIHELNEGSSQQTFIELDGNPLQCDPTDAAVETKKRSHCAWASMITHDSSRYPAVLVEAHRSSKCGHCLQNGFCEEIIYPVPVLRKTGQCDANGYDKYEGGWHRLVVGYTCVMASVLQATSH